MAEAEIAVVKTCKIMDVEAQIYAGQNEVWMTREQIGTMLGYTDPRDAIAKIHRRYKTRLDAYSRVVNLSTPQGAQETVVYSAKGIYEICRWSRQPTANEFYDKIYDVLEKIRIIGFYGQLTDDQAMKICRRKRITPDEYYQYVNGTPYDYLPLKARKEKRYQNQIVKLQAVADAYQLISDLYEYTISDIAQKAELTNDETWDVIRVMESRGYKFEYRELANKIRFTQDDKMKVYYFVNRERAESRGIVLAPPKIS